MPETDVARAAAIIFRDRLIAMIERRRAGKTYYIFPGGRVEPDESPESAAIREAAEELGLQISIKRLLAVVTFQGERQNYYHGEILGGEFGSGRGPEILGEYPAVRGTYVPVWLPLDRLGEMAVWPARLAKLLAERGVQQWPAEAIRFEDPGLVL